MGLASRVIVICVLIVGGLWLDGQVHDKDYAKTWTGQALKTVGGYELGLVAYENIEKNVQWAKDITPVYRKAFLEWSQPYRRLIRDISVVVFNFAVKIYNSVTGYVTDKYPVAQYWYLYYFGFCLLPGRISGILQGHSLIVHMNSILPETKVQQNLPEMRDAALNAAALAFDAARNLTKNGAVYMQKNVFVGSWSPDNMKKVTLEAFNATQQYATSTYSWILQAIAPQTPKSPTRN